MRNFSYSRLSWYTGQYFSQVIPVLSLSCYPDIEPYFPMQFQTAVEYQHFADRWFKCCVRVVLDPVSALNSWWNSGSSFGLAWMMMLFQLLFRAFNVSKVPILPPLYEVLFADFVVSKDSDICWIFDGWMKDFCECTFWIQYSVQGVILEKM